MKNLIHPRLTKVTVILTDGSSFQTFNVSNNNKYFFLDQDTRSNSF